MAVIISPSMTRLMNDVRLHLPGALDTVIQQEMFMMLTELCKNTNVWREDIPVALQLNVTSYQLVPTGTANIFRLMWVLDSNQLMVPAGMSTPGQLDLVNPPSSPAQVLTVTATVAEKPVDPVDNQNFPQFPSSILDQYRDDMLDGIVGRMMTQPAKPYTNKEMGTYHLRRWRTAMARIRVEQQRANGFRIQAWSYPQTFQTTPRRGWGSSSTANPLTFR
jgi:hypothetical protein